MAAPVAASATTIGGGGFGGYGSAGLGGGVTTMAAPITMAAPMMTEVVAAPMMTMAAPTMTMAAPMMTEVVAAPMITEMVGSTMATPLATTYGALPGMYF